MDGFFGERKFQSLASELRPGMGNCPFAVDGAAASHVSLLHFSGGRDATYVVVSRKLDGEVSPDKLAVPIKYRQFVEGTTIIYDATAETMQGKARPFVCHLEGSQRNHVYAVLPFQIEEISLRSEDGRLNVRFLEARGELVVAALPFELRLVDENGQLSSAECYCTDLEGCFSSDAAGASGAIVRSLLTGNEQSLTVAARNALRD